MVAELISVKEMQEEVAAMLTVCFEGKVTNLGNRLVLTLPNGQCFNIYTEEL